MVLFLYLFAFVSIAWADSTLPQNPSPPNDHQVHRMPKLAGPVEMPNNDEHAFRPNEAAAPVQGISGALSALTHQRKQLSVDERHALRQQINEAGNMYGKQRP
jgi:hypothetical protein